MIAPLALAIEAPEPALPATGDLEAFHVRPQREGGGLTPAAYRPLRHREGSVTGEVLTGLLH
jgi:hypothetical protein